MGQPTDTDRQRRRAIRRVISHVRDRVGPPPSNSELAKLAGVSPFHLLRIFRGSTNRGLAEHGRRVYLTRAAMSLRNSNRPIVQIAFDAGYANHESFSRAFRAEFNITPSAYRRTKSLPSNSRNRSMASFNPTISLVKIPVTDFKRARVFYRDHLGLVEDFAVEEYGWARYQAGAVPLCLYVIGMGGGDGKPGGELGFHLAISDAQAMYDHLKSLGCTFAEGVVKSDDGGVFFIVKDPDGNRLKIISSAP
jgi:AraC-like DNA-binding protein/catechol 2,3-dioxygenase-like lactoylglutathione lyase family enzyme